MFSALLAGAFLMPVAQADAVPVYMSYTGTGFDIPVFDYTVDPYPSNLVQGPATGTFGPSHNVIMSKFEFIESDSENCEESGQDYFRIEYASAVTSFKDGSQLYSWVLPGENSWMCLDPTTGAFKGSAAGIYIGGVGRFENVGGSFISPFVGQNLTRAEMGQVGFRAIKGSTEGTLIFY